MKRSVLAGVCSVALLVSACGSDDQEPAPQAPVTEAPEDSMVEEEMSEDSMVDEEMSEDSMVEEEMSEDSMVEEEMSEDSMVDG